MEGQTSVRRFDSGQLPARIRAQQLAESCPAASLADLLVRCFVRHALACLRRGHGHRAGPVEWPANDRNNSGESALQISNCRISWRRNYCSVDLFSRLDHRGLPTPGSPLVLAGRNSCLERAGLYSGRNASIHVGLEHCRIPGHVLELGAQLAHEGCWRDLDKSTNLQIYKKQAECSSGAQDECRGSSGRKILTRLSYAFCAWRRRNVGTSRSSAGTSWLTSRTFCWTWWTTFGDSCDIGGSAI